MLIKHPDCSLQLPWLSWGFCLFWGSFFDLKSLTEGWGLPGFFSLQKWTRNDHKPRDAKFVSFQWAGGRTSRTRKLMKIGHQINWINESSSHCLGFHFGLQLGKSIKWWPEKMVSLQNLQTFDHFTLTLVVAEKRLNTDIKRVGHRRNLETHSSERYRGSELVARSHCDSLDLHPRNGFYSELYLILLHISGSL